jgi:hypothetical protein
MGASAPKVRRKVGLMLRHLGRGELPQRVTAEWQKGLYPLLPSSTYEPVSTPIADDFEARSHIPSETQS